MKRFLIFLMPILLAACDIEPKLDTSSEEAIRVSSNKISEKLGPNELKEFSEAMAFYSFGGHKGKDAILGGLLSNAFNASEYLVTNLQVIDGLTGAQIIAKYQVSFDALQREEGNKAKIKQLKQDAEFLLESNKFQEALSIYSEMAELPLGADVAASGMANTKQAMSEFAEKAEYFDKIIITEFVSKRIDTYASSGIPAVRVSLKNAGDKSLKKVQVTVYFQGTGGEVIFEKTFTPVLVSKYSFTGNNDPLKPGYIREMEAEKYYTIESKLTDWDEGKAFIKVTDLDFM